MILGAESRKATMEIGDIATRSDNTLETGIPTIHIMYLGLGITQVWDKKRLKEQQLFTTRELYVRG